MSHMKPQMHQSERSVEINYWSAWGVGVLNSYTHAKRYPWFWSFTSSAKHHNEAFNVFVKYAKILNNYLLLQYLPLYLCIQLLWVLSEFALYCSVFCQKENFI